MQALGHLLKKILPRRARSTQTLVGVYLTPDRAWAVAMRQVGQEGFRVSAQASEKLGRDAWAETLLSLCHKVAPRGGDVSVALAPAFYSLLLVDAPPVDASELREAVKWRIKDLVNIHVDALVVDAFALPADAYRGRLNMIYAAAADRETVRKLAEINRDNLSLATISIQELALVQACWQNAQFHQGGTALLQIEDNGGAIYMIEGGHLYLSRTLDLSSRDHFSSQVSHDAEQKAERLALDVQRSLDYYESQIGKPAPARVAWLPSNTMNEALALKLAEQLTVNVVPLDLTTVAHWKTLPDTTEHLSWAIACGAALQGANADAAN